MKRLIIIGAGGHGKVCLEIARKMKKWNEISFLDDNKTGMVLDAKIIGVIKIANYVNDDTEFFVAIGDNTLRLNHLNELHDVSAKITSLIDSSATLSDYTSLGNGTVIMPGAIVNADTVIGDGVIVNTGVNIDHDCNINDCVHLSPGTSIGGSVSIGKTSWIGMNSTIINNISITNNVIVGAGSLIIKDINESGTYVGSPARKLTP